MKVTWAPAPGRVSHYRLKFGPSGGAKEAPIKVPAGVTSAVVRGLQPVTTYHITVEPIYKHGEGKARQGVGTTRTLVHLNRPPDRRSSSEPRPGPQARRLASPPLLSFLSRLLTLW